MAIPKGLFIFFDPHAYMALGAPYGGASPWMLRQGVLKALEQAQRMLQEHRPGWKIMVFDAYRPNAVQAFMVEREYGLLAQAEGLDLHKLSAADRERLSKGVFRLWGIPSEAPTTPPPHSTGAAIDLTLADEKGKEVDMGSPIDENSDRSNPDYFAAAPDAASRQADANRKLLNAIMAAQGFYRASDEWWHFSKGDQSAAWHERQANPGSQVEAIYGRADLV
ncbi:MAG: M15 family metallopeptidase [Alphaproteobacteria bacterium]|nr:M15 family metallopeptidase [Alphaproteobacteria bacterium]